MTDQTRKPTVIIQLIQAESRPRFTLRLDWNSWMVGFGWRSEVYHANGFWTTTLQVIALRLLPLTISFAWLRTRSTICPN